MSEVVLPNYENRVFSESEEIPEYLFALNRHTLTPPNGDIYIAAGAQAQLEQWERFKPVIKAAFKFRRYEMDRPLSPHLMPNIVDRALWSVARQIDPEGWPQEYQTVEKYFELFDKVLPRGAAKMGPKRLSNYYGKNPYFDQFFADCSFLNVLSNPVERAKGPRALMALYPEVFTPGISLVEGGGSALHILKALDSGFGLPETVIVEVDRETGHIIYNDVLTAKFNTALEQDLELGPSVGIDEWAWHAGHVRNVNRDHTITPAEEAAPPRYVRKVGEAGLTLMNAIERYDYLDRLESGNVVFVRGDLTDPDRIDWPEDERVPRKFGATLLSTVLQQQTPTDRANILATMKSLKQSLDAPEVIQDFVIPHPEDPHQLLFVDDIYSGAYLYTTNVYDEQVGWQTIWIHESGRLAKTEVGAGSVRVDGKLVPVRERLADFSA
jgi:hypothetical protein